MTSFASKSDPTIATTPVITTRPTKPARVIQVDAAGCQGKHRANERRSEDQQCGERGRPCCSADPSITQDRDLDHREYRQPSPADEDGTKVDPEGATSSRIATAVDVRANTSVAGLTSSTAIRMSR